MQIEAFVNHGRWIVSCPRCSGAQLLEYAKDRFICSEDNCSAEAEISVTPKRDKIEEILSNRPIANQNWLPDETLADLLRENKEHEVE